MFHVFGSCRLSFWFPCCKLPSLINSHETTGRKSLTLHLQYSIETHATETKPQAQIRFSTQTYNPSRQKLPHQILLLPPQPHHRTIPPPPSHHQDLLCKHVCRSYHRCLSDPAACTCSLQWHLKPKRLDYSAQQPSGTRTSLWWTHGLL